MVFRRTGLLFYNLSHTYVLCIWCFIAAWRTHVCQRKEVYYDIIDSSEFSSNKEPFVEVG